MTVLQARDGNTAVVKILLDAGANVDLTGYDKVTPLMYAGNPKLSSLLYSFKLMTCS